MSNRLRLSPLAALQNHRLAGKPHPLAVVSFGALAAILFLVLALLGGVGGKHVPFRFVPFCAAKWKTIFVSFSFRFAACKVKQPPFRFVSALIRFVSF